MRFFLIAQNTLREAFRQKIFHFVVLLSFGLIVGSLFFREFNFGISEVKFIVDFGSGAITFFGSMLAIVVTAQLFFTEIENRTVQTLLSKPVHRAEFILGKFCGVLLVLFIFMLLMTISLVLVLWVREAAIHSQISKEVNTGGWIHYGDLVLFSVIQWVKFGVISAFTLLIASFSRSNMYSIATSFFLVIICHLQYLAQEGWSTTSIWFMQGALRFFSYLIPNFQIFNLGDWVASGEPLPISLVSQAGIYGLLYGISISCLAAYSFSKREI
jgi:ABC-type transport system involved in multi-copper enzyme maturation permease subunit